ncbi:hypothetical protein HanHA89_Chr03g0094411 [Helianthus annuus]|nr:hypothetical protein HanHA89_Chr03g0094411 [Helianthus annuus]
MVSGAPPPQFEVLHQKKRKHEKLYQSHVFTQANQVSTSNQITSKWRTMHRERAEWEDYRDRLATHARQFEKAKAELAELKAQFEAEKKKQEWGLLGLKKKLQVSEDTLVEESQKWREACERNNQKMFDARTKITNLNARVEELTRSKVEFEERYEATKVYRKRAEMNQEELKQQLFSNDRDMARKDVEYAELKHYLRESQEKVESLEIDLEAEKQKTKATDEVRKFTQEALDVAQDNYAEFANAVLNSIELDQSVVVLTVPARHMGYPDDYIERASHVEVALKVKWEGRHFFVNAKVEKGFTQAEGRYNTLSLPIMDLVFDALQHEDYVARLKAIFKVHEAQELSYDEDEDVGDRSAK